jgi:hypothetical protein
LEVIEISIMVVLGILLDGFWLSTGLIFGLWLSIEKIEVHEWFKYYLEVGRIGFLQLPILSQGKTISKVCSTLSEDFWSKCRFGKVRSAPFGNKLLIINWVFQMAEEITLKKDPKKHVDERNQV